MQSVSRPLGELDFDGKTYVKVQTTGQRYKYVTDSGKRETQLWLCVEKNSSLPAKLELVPEIF